MILAAITGSTLLNALIWIVIGAVIFFLAQWFIAYVALKDPFLTVAKVVIGLLVLIFLVNGLLTLVGKPFISW